MLWFCEHKAIAAALPIISFGLGSTLSILVSDRMGFGYMGVVTMLVVFYSLNFLNAATLRRPR